MKHTATHPRHPPLSGRRLSGSDRLVGLFDDALRTVFGTPPKQRPTPRGAGSQQAETRDPELVSRMMRVNHSGEVCAQALYQAQALTARSQTVRDAMRLASLEENDHLCWCEERLHQLGSHKSYLNPVWYCGSFAIGGVFGLLGDRWNLGFLAETERQVVAHLDRHLDRLPDDDPDSRAILQQMRTDEAEHATRALQAGAIELPAPIKKLMVVVSGIMTGTAAWI